MTRGCGCVVLRRRRVVTCLLAVLAVVIQPLAAGAACQTSASHCHKCCPSAPQSPAPRLSAAANCCGLSTPRNPDWSPQPGSIQTSGPSNADAVGAAISMEPPAASSVSSELGSRYDVVSPPIPPLHQACLLLI